MYADDIILIAPTVTGLQRLLNVCETELVNLDMRINVSKSMCIRFGPRFNIPCADLTSIHGGTFKWVDSCRYLGVYLVCGRTFKCSLSQAKSKLIRAFNAIYSKIGRNASEITTVTLLRSKCLPILLYATEACPILSREKQSMDFAVTRIFMKMFKTVSPAIIVECQRNFNFLPIGQQLIIRTAKFLQCFIASENVVCTLFAGVAASQLSGLFSAHGSAVNTVDKLTNANFNLHCAPLS